MISTIVIAAAGRGSRMKGLSSDKPKQLITVAGKPFFHFVLESITQAGFERIVVVVGYQADAMKAFCENANVPVEIVNQHDIVGEKYGTAVVIEAIADAIGNKPFVFQNGDSMFTQDAYELVRNAGDDSVILGAYHEDPSQYAVLNMSPEGRLTEIIEKPENPTSNVTNIGLYAFQPQIIELAKEVEVSPRGEYEITDAINSLAQSSIVRVEQLSGAWTDLGKPEDIPEVEQFMKENGYV